MRKLEKLIRAVLCVAAGTLFVFSACKLLGYRQETKASADYNEDLVAQTVTSSSKPEITTEPHDFVVDVELDVQEEEKPDDAEDPPISVDFEALKKENEDVVGWLYCPDTPINYPVLQAEDNDYYLRRLMNGEWNIAGSLFMDYRNDPVDMDWNTVIYGHNINNASMFGTLPLYRDQAYYETHPVMYYLTPDTEYKIELVCALVTPADSALYNLYLSETERIQVLADLVSASDFTSQVELNAEDRLLTLSTCVYEYESARYVVIGKIAEMTEEP